MPGIPGGEDRGHRRILSAAGRRPRGGRKAGEPRRPATPPSAGAAGETPLHRSAVRRQVDRCLLEFKEILERVSADQGTRRGAIDRIVQSQPLGASMTYLEEIQNTSLALGKLLEDAKARLEVVQSQAYPPNGWSWVLNAATGQGYRRAHQLLVGPTKGGGPEEIALTTLVARVTASDQAVGEKLSTWSSAVKSRKEFLQKLDLAREAVRSTRTAVTDLSASGWGPQRPRGGLSALRRLLEELEKSLAEEAYRLEHNPMGLNEWTTRRAPTYLVLTRALEAVGGGFLPSFQLATTLLDTQEPSRGWLDQELEAVCELLLESIDDTGREIAKVTTPEQLTEAIEALNCNVVDVLEIQRTIRRRLGPAIGTLATLIETLGSHEGETDLAGGLIRDVAVLYAVQRALQDGRIPDARALLNRTFTSEGPEG